MGTYAGKDWSGRAQVPEREQTIGGYTNVMAGGPTGSSGIKTCPKWRFPYSHWELPSYPQNSWFIMENLMNMDTMWGLL